MIKRLELIAILSLFVYSCFSQSQSGILLGGGIGFENVKHNSNSNNIVFNSNYKYNFQLGYRFRFGDFTSNRLFFDIDPLMKLQALNDKTFYPYSYENYTPTSVKASNVNFQLAVSSSVNYRLFKDFYAGIGIEPTWNLITEGKHFDFPIIGRIGYNIKGKLEIALTYRHGIVNVVDKDLYKKGTLSDLNIGIFIPFYIR